MPCSKARKPKLKWLDGIPYVRPQAFHILKGDITPMGEIVHHIEMEPNGLVRIVFSNSTADLVIRGTDKQIVRYRP